MGSLRTYAEADATLVKIISEISVFGRKHARAMSEAILEKVPSPH